MALVVKTEYFWLLLQGGVVFLMFKEVSCLKCCRVYPYNCRYRLYGSWKSDTYAIHPPLMRKRVEVQKKAKAIMQRISKENVKPTSRKIGKVTNSSPGLMFDYVSISLGPFFYCHEECHFT